MIIFFPPFLSVTEGACTTSSNFFIISIMFLFSFPFRSSSFLFSSLLVLFSDITITTHNFHRIITSSQLLTITTHKIHIIKITKVYKSPSIQAILITNFNSSQTPISTKKTILNTPKKGRAAWPPTATTFISTTASSRAPSSNKQQLRGCLVSCNGADQAHRMQGLLVWLPGAPFQPGYARAIKFAQPSLWRNEKRGLACREGKEWING